jgi:hypothetical protein
MIPFIGSTVVSACPPHRIQGARSSASLMFPLEGNKFVLENPGKIRNGSEIPISVLSESAYGP